MLKPQTTDWRASFRLHAMDLNTMVVDSPAAPSNWVMQEASLAKMVEHVLDDCANARRAGATEELPTDAAAFLATLPFLQAEAPKTFAAQAVFTLRFSIACGTQSLRAIRERSAALARTRPLAG